MSHPGASPSRILDPWLAKITQLFEKRSPRAGKSCFEASPRSRRTSPINCDCKRQDASRRSLHGDMIFQKHLRTPCRSPPPSGGHFSAEICNICPWMVFRVLLPSAASLPFDDFWNFSRSPPGQGQGRRRCAMLISKKWVWGLAGVLALSGCHALHPNQLHKLNRGPNRMPRDAYQFSLPDPPIPSTEMIGAKQVSHQERNG